MLKFVEIKLVEVQDWDSLVEETYGRVYHFQQQDDCKQRGTYEIHIPCEHPYDYENESVPEKVNGNERGVSFKAWLARDPEQELDSDDEWERNNGLDLFYRRNFYPHIEILANDLHAKGLIPEGDYLINIDW